MRGLLLLFAILFATFTQLSGIPDQDDVTEFYVLMLGGTLGMCLMISANHILIVLLGVEMASVPCYVLAGMLRDAGKSSEAALKYAVFGAGTAGVMLYGISLLAGVLGSAHLPTMTAHWPSCSARAASPSAQMVLILGGLMLTVGVAFKLSAVPFHFWAPTCSRGRRPKWPRSSRSPRRPPRWGCWCASALAFARMFRGRWRLRAAGQRSRSDR